MEVFFDFSVGVGRVSCRFRSTMFVEGDLYDVVLCLVEGIFVLICVEGWVKTSGP